MSDIGTRRERIRFVRPSRSKRTDGGFDVADSTVAERWASVRPVAANEQEQASRLRGAVTYLIELPRLDGLTIDDAVVWLTRGSVRLNIREIRTDAARPLTMTIVAQSGVIQ